MYSESNPLITNLKSNLQNPSLYVEFERVGLRDVLERQIRISNIGCTAAQWDLIWDPTKERKGDRGAEKKKDEQIASWLSVIPSSGHLAPGQSQSVTLRARGANAYGVLNPGMKTDESTSLAKDPNKEKEEKEAKAKKEGKEKNHGEEKHGMVHERINREIVEIMNEIAIIRIQEGGDLFIPIIAHLVRECII